MKIISPSAEIIDPKLKTQGIALLRKIERMARISHRSEDRQTEDSWKRFIQAVVMEHGDWSVVEHASATVLFRVDRGISHELVRHRLFSYTQESTRFVRYKDDLEFIIPGEIEMCCSPNPLKRWKDNMQFSEDTYKGMIGYNMRPQAARSVLPNSLATTVAVTGNLRNWRWFFLARSSKETHPDFRIVVDPLLAEFKMKLPLLYDDINVGERQIDNMRKPR